MSEEIIDLRKRVTETITAIHESCYFIPLWELCKHERGIEEIDNVSELLEPFQDFWERLPDDQSCRRFPFFYVCELAEKYMDQ